MPQHRRPLQLVLEKTTWRHAEAFYIWCAFLPIISQTSLAKKRALLQQQRKQRKLEADRMLARRQSGQIGPSSKVKQTTV